MNVMAFLALYVATHAVGTLVLTGLGSDLVTAGSAALAAMSSIGPGLGAVGPAMLLPTMVTLVRLPM